MSDDRRGRREGDLIRADRPGIALLVVLLVTLMVAAIAAGAALIGANTYLVNEYDKNQSLLESVADAGLELNRARLNANPSLYRDTALVPLELNVAVTDALGAPIPGVRRTTYAMPVGGGAGEHGNFAALISIAEMGPARVVRRLDLLQESLATFAYFTDVEPINVFFGGNDQLYGRVHSNGDIKILASGATFHGLTTTATRFVNPQNATFLADTMSGVTPIPFPGAGTLTQLESRAAPGNMVFTSPNTGGVNQAGMRIEFVSRALEDPNGPRTGFIRVYVSQDSAWWVTGQRRPGRSMITNRACGHFHNDDLFHSHWNDSTEQHSSLTSSSRRCYLGGADSIWGGTFTPSDGRGQWLPWPGEIHPSVASQPDAAYLWPIDRALNEGFRGVIYVKGKVVVSGTVRGRVTLAATGNIIIGDNIVYDTDPGAGTCRDILGLFSGQRVVVSDNFLNAPQQFLSASHTSNTSSASGSSTFRSYGSNRDEHIHASILALEQFHVENHNAGSQNAEPCQGTSAGRGCLYVNGGIIQHTRGAVGTATGFGYIKRYTFDQCVFQTPPPYFPSTGHFWAGRVYDIDPTGFGIGAYFNTLN